MPIYRKDEQGRVYKTAGNAVQRWNDKLFLTTHTYDSIENKDYYDIEELANKYIIGLTDYTEFQLYFTEANQTQNVYIRFGGKSLRVTRSDGDPLGVGYLRDRASFYTKQASIDNAIWMDRLLQPPLDTYRGGFTYAVLTWDQDSIPQPNVGDTAIALDTNVSYEWDEGNQEWDLTGELSQLSNGWYWQIDFFPDYNFGNGKIMWDGGSEDWSIYTARVPLPDEETIVTDAITRKMKVALGTLATQAYYGDLGDEAYQHSQSTHAPTDAQKNVQSDWNQTDNTEDDYIKNKPTIPTIPDLELNDDAETNGKYISKIEVDSANKHKLNITKQDLPQGFSGDYDDLTNKPVSVIFEITSFTELTTLQKTTITNQLMPLLNINLTDLDTNKYSDLILKYLDERYHYSSVAVIDGEVIRILFDYKNEDTKIKLDINYVGDDSQTVIELVTINYELEGTVSTHNTSETAHSDIRNAVAEAKAIAEGKARARVFATVTALDAWLAIPENVALLLVGDNFYIEETDKPDYWWNGTNKVKLETEKVDLTEYVKTADLPPQLTLGTLATQAYYGDLGHEAYQHSQATHAPTDAQKNVQSDWNQTDNTKDDYIKNKPTIPTIPDITVNNGSAESGKYISKIEVDGTNKHKLNITKKDLPQGFSGSYNDLTDKPNVYTKDEADKLFNEIIPIYQVFTDEIGDQLSDIMFDGGYPYRPYYAYNSTSGQLYAYNETNETWGIGFAPSRSRLYYTAKFGTLTVYLYNTTTSKLENIIPTISTSITTDATSDTKTASPKAVKTYVDNVLGDIETLLEAL